MSSAQISSETGDQVPAGRIRSLCAQQGWDIGELARRAQVSRTTLYQLDRRRIRRPHAATLGRIAAALGLSLADLLRPAGPEPANGRELDRRAAERAFDRLTNPVVADVLDQRPELFENWSADEWDELYSTFGTGGQLTPDGVVQAAEAIARKRETVQQLHVLLETHLGDVAANMIATLYQMVRPQPQTQLRDGQEITTS